MFVGVVRGTVTLIVFSVLLMWQVLQRLTSIVDFWGERQVYSMEAVADLKKAIPGPGPAPAVQVHLISIIYTRDFGV